MTVEEVKVTSQKEKLGDLLKNGFDTWKNNLNICLPFVFSFLIYQILKITIMGSVFSIGFHH